MEDTRTKEEDRSQYLTLSLWLRWAKNKPQTCSHKWDDMHTIHVSVLLFIHVWLIVNVEANDHMNRICVYSDSEVFHTYPRQHDAQSNVSVILLSRHIHCLHIWWYGWLNFNSRFWLITRTWADEHEHFSPKDCCHVRKDNQHSSQLIFESSCLPYNVSGRQMYNLQTNLHKRVCV